MLVYALRNLLFTVMFPWMRTCASGSVPFSPSGLCISDAFPSRCLVIAAHHRGISSLYLLHRVALRGVVLWSSATFRFHFSPATALPTAISASCPGRYLNLLPTPLLPLATSFSSSSTYFSSSSFPSLTLRSPIHFIHLFVLCLLPPCCSSSSLPLPTSFLHVKFLTFTHFNMFPLPTPLPAPPSAGGKS